MGLRLHDTTTCQTAAAKCKHQGIPGDGDKTLTSSDKMRFDEVEMQFYIVL